LGVNNTKKCNTKPLVKPDMSAEIMSEKYLFKHGYLSFAGILAVSRAIMVQSQAYRRHM
jgi:hypothetical protein